MSSCDSDSDSSENDKNYKCTCGFHHSDDDSDCSQNDDKDDEEVSDLSESSDSDEDDSDNSVSDSSSSLTDDYDSFVEESSDQFDDSIPNLFICHFDKINDANENLISSNKEIKNYRDKYSNLSIKSSKSINTIWSNVRVYVPASGKVSLKTFDQKLEEELKNKKKRLKKPSEVQIKKMNEPCSSDEETKNTREQSNTLVKKTDAKSDTKSNGLNQKSNKKANSETNNQNKNRNTDVKVQPDNSQNTKVANDVNNQTKNQKKKSQKEEKTNIIDKITMTQTSLLETMTHKPNKINIKNKPTENTVDNGADSVITKSSQESNRENINSKNIESEMKKPIDNENEAKSQNSEINEELNSKESNNIIVDSGNKNESEIIESNDIPKVNDSEIRKTSDTETSIIDIENKEEVNNKETNIQSKERNNVPEPETYVEYTQYDLDDILSKRKLKKIKQKEKKSQNTNKDSVNLVSKNVSESAKATKTKKDGKLIEQSSESDEEYYTDEGESSDDENDLLDPENMPAFVSQLVKRKRKPAKQVKVKSTAKTVLKTSDEKKTVPPKVDHKQQHVAKPVSHAPDQNMIYYSEKLAEDGALSILENNLSAGLEFLIGALDYNPNDDRHVLNRCYCYLRLNWNALALTDAQYVIKFTTHFGHKFIANIRAGQASIALQKYQHAEMYLKEATRLNPENQHARRELIRAKIARLVNMGFNERDSAVALERCPSTTDAIGYLSQTYKDLNSSKAAKKFEIPPVEEWDEWAYTSDDDEKPNSVEIVNQITKFKPGKTKLFHLISKSSNPRIIAKIEPKPRSQVNTPELRKITVTSAKPPEVTGSKSIWVGSLAKKVSDAAIKSTFKQFGTVTSIYRPPHEHYAFVNFDKCEAVNKIRNYQGDIVVDGRKVCIKNAVRK